MHREVVLGPSLCVRVVHQSQVSYSSAPFSILAWIPPQQTHSHKGCVVVLKGNPVNLERKHQIWILYNR